MEETADEQNDRYLTKIELLNYQISNNKALVKLEDGISGHVDLVREVLQKLYEDKVKIEFLEEELDNTKISLRQCSSMLLQKDSEIRLCHERIKTTENDYENKLKKVLARVEKLSLQLDENKKDSDTKIKNLISEQELMNSNTTRKINHFQTMVCSKPSVSGIDPLAEEIAKRIMQTGNSKKWKKTRIMNKLKRFTKNEKVNKTKLN